MKKMQQKRFYFMFWSKMLLSFPSHCTKTLVLLHSPCLREQGRFPGSSGIRLLYCSLLLICSTLQGWSPIKKSLCHADSGSNQRPLNNRNILFSYKILCAPVFGAAASRKQQTDGYLCRWIAFPSVII